MGSSNKQVSTHGASSTGQIPVISQSKTFIDGYINDRDKKISIVNPIILFGDHTKVVKYIDFDFVVGGDGTKLLVPIAVDPKFFYYIILYFSSLLPDRGYERNFSFLRRLIVSVPPLSEQMIISSKLDYAFSVLKK